jgi:outer membrane protein assembly factor BamB
MLAYQGSHVTVVGKNVVYTDPQNRIHALDVATGKELRSGSFSDRARRLCPLGDSTVYVDTTDEKPVTFDVTSGATVAVTKKGDAPAACGRRARYDENLPKVAGIQMDGGGEGFGRAVAWGYKSPGTPVMSLFGYDPKTRAVLWQSPLAGAGQNASDQRGMDAWAFAANRVYVTYKVQGTNDENRIVAFDSSSGARLWDVPLRGIFAVDSVYGMGATDAFVLVHRMGIIDVLDARTGKQRGTYLHTSYDDEFKH